MNSVGLHPGNELIGRTGSSDCVKLGCCTVLLRVGFSVIQSVLKGICLRK